ncbi:uncharacterized protein LOC144362085 [Saccoglossus kowalevskii]
MSDHPDAPAQNAIGATTSFAQVNKYTAPDYTHFPKIQELELSCNSSRAKHAGYVRKRPRLPKIRKVEVAAHGVNSQSDTTLGEGERIADDSEERLPPLVKIPSDLYSIRKPMKTGVKDGDMSLPKDALYFYGGVGLDTTPKKPESRLRLLFHTRQLTDLSEELSQKCQPPQKMNKDAILPVLEKVPKKPSGTSKQQPYGKQGSEQPRTKFISQKSVTSSRFSQPAFKNVPSMPLCDVFRYKESMRRALAHGRPLGKSKETLGEKSLLSATTSISSENGFESEAESSENKSQVVFPIIVNYNEVHSDEIVEEFSFRKMKATSLGRPMLRTMEDLPPSFQRSNTLCNISTTSSNETKQNRRVRALKVRGRATELDRVRPPSETSFRELGHLKEDSENSNATNVSGSDGVDDVNEARELENSMSDSCMLMTTKEENNRHVKGKKNDKLDNAYTTDSNAIDVTKHKSTSLTHKGDVCSLETTNTLSGSLSSMDTDDEVIDNKSNIGNGTQAEQQGTATEKNHCAEETDKKMLILGEQNVTPSRELLTHIIKTADDKMMDIRKTPKPLTNLPANAQSKSTPNRAKGISLISGPFVFLPVALASIRNINELSKRVKVIDTDQYDKFRNERVYMEREDNTEDDDDDDEEGGSEIPFPGGQPFKSLLKDSKSEGKQSNYVTRGTSDGRLRNCKTRTEPK